MTSNSPRSRINQFFATRKRKSISPGGGKLKRAEKDGRLNTDVSPGGKGTLESFLINSQDDNSSRILRKGRDLVKQESTKRNLILEINSCSDRGNNHELKRVTECSSKAGDDAVTQKDMARVCFDSSQPVENTELKQFANDFLSLYCSELPSTSGSPSTGFASDVHKRSGSPSLVLLDEKTHKKRHQNEQCVKSELQIKPDYCKDKNSEDLQSHFVSRALIGDSATELQPSLRKCNRAAEFVNSPNTVANVSAAGETPKSWRGSSLSSPGEAFWNEAIQVADGLFAPNEGSATLAGQEPNTVRSKCSVSIPDDFRIKSCGHKSNEQVNHNENRLQRKESTAHTRFGKHKNSVNDVSPFPVKHFDFSSEDKNLAKDINYGSLENLKAPSLEEVILTKNGSFKSDGLKKTCSLEPCDNAYINRDVTGGVKEIACSVSTQSKVDTSCKLQGDIFSSAKENEMGNLMTTHDYEEESTPSIMDQLDLSHWVPPEICGIYRKKGISQLYPWQVECLKVDGVLQRRNLVYCASTSAGKSFVAEILMLRRVVLTGKMALLVLPYVSICAEKSEHLEVLLEPLGKHIRSYYGNQGGGTLPKDTSVAVCTIEKANSLINRLLEEGRLSEVGIIVIDELHMVGDQHRGYLLELMLTKLRYAAGEGNAESCSGDSSGTSSGKGENAHSLQIVGMSATMPNVEAVSEWLEAALYQTEFRPVPLEEYIKVGNTIYDRKMDIVRTISKRADLGGKDPDHVVELCNEVVQEGHSVLIFCCSRKGCESTARHVSRFVKKFSTEIHGDSNEFTDIATAIDALRRCPAGLDPILEETLPAGVAYHHAGLTVEEREIVESCYRKGLVRVLCATSTLAAGVNLPARRVIFRQPKIGRDFIDGTRYRQMAGRAGRTGIDTKGESILLCKPEEIKRIMTLLNDNCPPLHSCLSEDKNGMTHAILEVVAGGIVQSANDIHRYVRCTLLNSTKPFDEVVKSAQDSLRWLCHKKFLEWNNDTKLYSTTPLGRAAFGSSLSPEESLIVLDDLLRAREAFVLSSDLHLVYLVTPTNVDVEPDWELYYERFMQLSSLDQSVGNRVGVTEPFLMRLSHGAPVCNSTRSRDNLKGLQGKLDTRLVAGNNNMLSDDQMLRVCKRFYVSLILSRLVQETPVVEVCEAFRVARGMVQSLQENAGRFASMVSVFCERLGWQDLEGLVAKFQNRVSFGVRAEIVELTTIPYVKGSRARALYKAGLRTPLAIAEASIPQIVKALFESSSWSAEENSVRRIHLGLAKKIKNGARKIVLEKAEEARVAAFSAFKSLGLDVPKFPRPELSSVNDDVPGQIFESSSREEPLRSSSSDIAIVDLISAKPSKEGATISHEAVSEFRKKDFVRTSDIQFASSAEVKSTDILPNGVDAENLSADKFSEACGNPTVALDCGDAGRALSTPFVDSGCLERTDNAYSVHQRSEKQHTRNLYPGHGSNASDVGPMYASKTPGGFDQFLDFWDTMQEFCFDIHFNKQSHISAAALFEINGIALCWENSPVYYINVPKDLLSPSSLTSSISTVDNHSLQNPLEQLDLAKKRWKMICRIMEKKLTRKFTWNLRIQIQALKGPAIPIQRFGSLSQAVRDTGVELVDSSFFKLAPIKIQDGIDLTIVAWVLWPDEERSSSPSLEKEAKKRLSAEAASAASRNGMWKNQMRRVAHNGCCRRVAQIRALVSVLWKLIVSEGLTQPLSTIELPLVNVLADMEIWGIGVDMEGCLQARHVLGRKLRLLETEAHRLAGMKFSLYMTADIANVLYGHLKLPIPEGGKKGKQHPSTDKHSLDLLRNEHPIVPIIKEHRTLAKLLNCTLGSMCSMAKLSMKGQKYTLHGHWLQTSTATGRLSMEEPNLQCVEHVVEFKMNDEGKRDPEANQFKINARDFFTPTEENWLLLTADYSQIELRIMAHFSEDSSLIDLLRQPQGDVFNMIAARWTRKSENDISPQERDQTKRLVYGILYGMGAKSLAEQLGCCSDEAAEKIQSFKSTFPGVASWLNNAVASCRQKGFIETLKGRKRFLSKIKHGDGKERSKAQRQAVNSICQGSAADIIKIAMINMYSVITKDPSSVLNGRCRILLQVHDELVLEAHPSVVKEAASLLQISMETSVSLLVPLRVKLRVGRTWGSLDPFPSQKM